MSLSCKVLENNQLSAVSRLFSSKLIRELARRGASPMFARLARESSLLDGAEPEEPIRNLFDRAFSLMKRKNYRHEYIYKAAIAHKVLLGTHSLQTAVMLNEFRVGANKADSVILNGTSSVYEIKSERDSLSRLEQQLRAYRDVFAKVNVIIGENHINSVFEMTQDDVGVLVLTNRYQISTVREAVECPERTKPEVIFNSIRLNEAKKVLKILGKGIPALPNTQMHEALEQVFKTLNPAEVHRAMVSVLRVTRSLSPISEFLNTLPGSLQAAVLSTPLRKQDRIRLLKAIDTPIHIAQDWM